jgi:hypothetical protein
MNRVRTERRKKARVTATLADQPPISLQNFLQTSAHVLFSAVTPESLIDRRGHRWVFIRYTAEK